MWDVELDLEKKQCVFWVYGEHRDGFSQQEEFQEVMTTYQNKGYEILVFVGGQKPLLPAMAELFQLQEGQKEQIEAS